MRSIKKRSVVGSLLDIGEMERSDRSLFFSDDKNMNRRLTSSSSGYSSSKPTQRFSQVQLQYRIMYVEVFTELGYTLNVFPFC